MATRMGFVPSQAKRQPVYGIQVLRKLGYVEHAGNGIWFQDATGKRVGRILRYKAHPYAECNVHSSGTVPYGLGSY